jgi:Ca-activated chloride channel family protein
VRQGAFVVLMTDGASNRGVLSPLEAAAVARAQGVPVYAISIGTGGMVEMPTINAAGEKEYRLMQSEVDEGTLWRMTQLTGGRFFHGGNSGTIEHAFAAIDEARKIEFQARTFLLKTELFPRFLWPGAILLGLAAASAMLPQTLRERTAQATGHALAVLRLTSHAGASVFRRQARNFFI